MNLTKNNSNTEKFGSDILITANRIKESAGMEKQIDIKRPET